MATWPLRKRVLRREDGAAESSCCRLVALVPDRTRCGHNPPLTEGIHGCNEEEMGLARDPTLRHVRSCHPV